MVKKELRPSEDIKAILWEYTRIYPSEIKEIRYQLDETDIYVEMELWVTPSI